jgi:lipoyl(octanoyl) transferase
MRTFTATRHADQPDEIWLLEHEPVFTQGLAGKPEHILHTADIPVIRTERGGQVTYHGPGQVVAYTLIDLARRGLGVRDMVCRLEAAAIDTCALWGVSVMRKPGAPGLYLRGSGPDQGPDQGLEQCPDQGTERGPDRTQDQDQDQDQNRLQDRPGAKIASLGLKISRGCSYHGIALNVDMDLSPFGHINPCGYAGLPVTDLRRAGARPTPDLQQAAQAFGALLAEHLHRPT